MRDIKKVEEHMLAVGYGWTSKVRRRAGLDDCRTEEEVQELTAALRLLIYRSGGIKEARESREEKATQMVFKDENEIPREVMVNPTGSISEGAKLYYAKQDRLKQAQLSPGSKQLGVTANSTFITAGVTQQVPSCAHKALLSVRNIERLKKDGPLFYRQLKQRAALDSLFLDADTPEATTLLNKLLMVLCNNQGSFMFRWWGPKDNKALLWNYWKRGFNLSGSRRATPALHAFVEWLIDHHSTRRFDFTVEIVIDSAADMDQSCPPPAADHKDKATVVWNGWQLGAFKQFLISQLRDLMEGLTSPTVLEKQLGHQKYFKQLGLKNMVMPVAAAGADRGDNSHGQDNTEEQSGSGAEESDEEDSSASSGDEEEGSEEAEQEEEDAAPAPQQQECMSPASKRTKTDANRQQQEAAGTAPSGKALADIDRQHAELTAFLEKLLPQHRSQWHGSGSKSDQVKQMQHFVTSFSGYSRQHSASVLQQGAMPPQQQQQQLRPCSSQQQQPPAGHAMQQQAEHAMHSAASGMYQQAQYAAAYAAAPHAPQSAQPLLAGPRQHVPPVPQQPQAAGFGSAVGAAQQATVGPGSHVHAAWEHAALQGMLREQQMLSTTQQVLQSELAAVLHRQQHLNAVAQGLFRNLQQPR